MECTEVRDENGKSPRWVTPTIVLTIIATALIPFFFLYLIHLGGPVGLLLKEHAAAALGIPWAAGGSSVVVLMFRFLPGQLEVKALGIEIKGSAAPALFWVICFMASVSALAILW